MSLLGGLMGGSNTGQRSGMSPLTMGLLALLAYKAMHKTTATMDGTTQPQTDSGGMFGGLGNLGGALGNLGNMGSLQNVLLGGGGLGAILDKFKGGGFGDVINSWINTGPNQQIAPTELHQALGEDTVKELSQQTGKPAGTILDELSNLLPGFIDKLTPQGRLPTEAEANQNTTLGGQNVA